MVPARIMIVEDEGLVALGIKEGLESLGYEVTAVASSADGAINQALSTEPDLVLMDIHLKGGTDGIEAAKQLKQTLNIPVVFLTAYSDQETLKRAIATEPFAYLIKPFEERTLHTTIQTTLHKAQQENGVKWERDWLASIVNSLADGVLIVDFKGIVKYINTAAERLIAYSRGEAEGKRLPEILKIIDRQTGSDCSIPLTETILEGKTVKRKNCLLVAGEKDGIPIDSNCAPLKNKAGNRIGVIISLRLSNS
jgi:PAS domain S-box-containing protein